MVLKMTEDYIKKVFLNNNLPYGENLNVLSVIKGRNYWYWQLLNFSKTQITVLGIDSITDKFNGMILEIPYGNLTDIGINSNLMTYTLYIESDSVEYENKYVNTLDFTEDKIYQELDEYERGNKVEFNLRKYFIGDWHKKNLEEVIEFVNYIHKILVKENNTNTNSNKTTYIIEDNEENEFYDINSEYIIKEMKKKP